MSGFAFFRSRSRSNACGVVSESSSLADLLSSDMAQLHPPYVVEANAVGVKERAKNPKRFVFQINIKWSDDSTSTSYRSYSDFFNYQCDLLTEFPKEAGTQKGYERTVPFLPGKKLFQKSDRKLAESRLPQIDEYVKALISMPENISQNGRTSRFFRSNWQEDRLQSEDGDAVKYTVKQMSKGLFRYKGDFNGHSTLPSRIQQENTEVLSSGEHGEISGI